MKKYLSWPAFFLSILLLLIQFFLPVVVLSLDYTMFVVTILGLVAVGFGKKWRPSLFLVTYALVFFGLSHLSDQFSVVNDVFWSSEVPWFFIFLLLSLILLLMAALFALPYPELAVILGVVFLMYVLYIIYIVRSFSFGTWL